MKKTMILILLVLGMTTKMRAIAYPADSATYTVWGTTATLKVVLWEQDNGNGTDSFWVSLVRTPAVPPTTFSSLGLAMANIAGGVIGNMIIPAQTPISTYGFRGSITAITLTAFLKIRVSNSVVSPSSPFGEVFINFAWSHTVSNEHFTMLPDTVKIPHLTVSNWLPNFSWIYGVYNTRPSLITQVPAVLNVGNYMTKVSSTSVTDVDTVQLYYVRAFSGASGLPQWYRDTTRFSKCSCGNWIYS